LGYVAASGRRLFRPPVVLQASVLVGKQLVGYGAVRRCQLFGEDTYDDVPAQTHTEGPLVAIRVHRLLDEGLAAWHSRHVRSGAPATGGVEEDILLVELGGQRCTRELVEPILDNRAG